MRTLSRILLVLLGGGSILAEAALSPRSIPRGSSHKFVREGLFEGGIATRANLEGLRFAEHPSKGFERWVVDFSDPARREVGSVAPQFQLSYAPGESFLNSEGGRTVRSHPRFIFRFQAIADIHIRRDHLIPLIRKSPLVRDIVLYPKIENGDMAMEFVLEQDVVFEAHQPLEREGRLVLDLRPDS